MPLFEIENVKTLIPFRQVLGGADLYERHIEDLLWNNLEEFTGESLFRIARQPRIKSGGRPDVVVLDREARVVVIEVKRDVDRGQLAQCLEYAGWARTTNLDELAGMYHRGPENFWPEWLEFTGSATPVRVRKSPRLLLVAREFEGRTREAFEFLFDNHLPVSWIPVAVYEDQQGRKFLDVEGEHEPEFAGEAVADGGTEVVNVTKIEGRRVRLSDLLDAQLIQAGQVVIWDRPRLGDTYRATITETGGLQLDNGRSFSSPSRAAMEAANIPACDGWWAWRLDGPDGEYLHKLRIRLAERANH